MIGNALKVKSVSRWALRWYSKNKVDGKREHIIYDNCIPALFVTRAKAREFAEKHYGYIKNRKDLRIEPHGWRCPRCIQVQVIEI